ncbi:hypothetical protein [Shinella zoogloeoides]|uniref:hypothetical protein n=1 Tax=Shinella zoogloeoides TaxID=352475 RepID=UPI001F566CDA|nr:hypothetical protein [Shinella zoogloeoides]
MVILNLPFVSLASRRGGFESARPHRLMDKERRHPALVPMKIALFLIAVMQKARPFPGKPERRAFQPCRNIRA